jgi:hypothetical protein
VVSDARAHAEEERLYHFSLEHITKLWKLFSWYLILYVCIDTNRYI